MISSLDHIIVAVSDLDKAEQDYIKIFGTNPIWKGEHKELGQAILSLTLIIHILSSYQQREMDWALLL